jgi:tetratricopeptide (TPR) repeat protein
MPDLATRFAVLLFTDIVGSTDLKGRFGVPAYHAALQTHNAHFERLARMFSSVRILQNMGDGYFAEAGSVAEAVRFALLFQEAMRAGPWGEIVLKTRVGIHAGEVTALASEGGSGIVAPAADLAARVMGLAVGGQILLTRFPFDEARHFLRADPSATATDVPLQWLAHGPYLLKGCEDPIEIFEVGVADVAPLVPPPDGEKARRAVRPGEEQTLGWRPAAGLEVPGRTDWKLVERLGAGGFGEVWVAEHARLREKRAFKFCFDDDRLRALKREVTLTRLLRTALGDRDDIVRFFELKLDAPPFYLESEYSPEGNLLQWAERQGGLEKVPLATRLELVAATATALAAAHSVGVLHKDIKPSNVLIFKDRGETPRPRLVDFGIGTLADHTVLGAAGVTQMGFTQATIAGSSGTPLYSPPEYLAGRPYTVQGDVFGLGVMLYQMVTADAGRPLAPGWERDVPDEFLRDDIASCVDGDPARRLPSAADLATRLRTLETRRAEAEAERALARQAAEATEANARALVARERAVRLRRLATVFGLLAVLAIAAGVVAWMERGKARAAEQAAMLEMRKAKESRIAAEELVGFMQYDLRDSLGKIGRLEMMKEINARIAKYHVEHPADGGDRRAVLQAERERSSTIERRGDLRREEGQLDEALGDFREALAMRERLVTEVPADDDAQRIVGLSRNRIGRVLRRQGKLKAALAEFQSAQAIFEKLRLAVPDEAGRQSDVGVTLTEMADVLRDLGQGNEALKAAREAAAIFGKLNRKASAGWRQRSSYARSQIGEILRAQGKLEEALAEHQASLELMRQLSEEEPENATALREYSVACDHVGDLLSLLKRDGEALAIFQKGMEIAKRLVAQDPANTGWQRDLIVGGNKLGDFHYFANQLAEAEKAYRESFAIAERLTKLDPTNALWQRDLSTCHAKLGDLHMDRKEVEKAVAEFRASLELRRKLLAQEPANGQTGLDVAMAASRVGDALLKLPTPDPSEARRMVAEGLGVLAKLPAEVAARQSAKNIEGWLKEVGEKAGK